MSLRGFFDLFNINNGAISLDAPSATGSMEDNDEADTRIVILERKVDIQEKAIMELLDSTIKCLKSVAIISRGFDLTAQKDLSAELEELGRIEDFVHHHSLSKQR